MHAWAGLGYYARARNLHACARAVAAQGGFPPDVAALRALPGIGPYTAAAVAAIAFGVPVVPVDGNVERVAARVFAIGAPLPGAKAAIATAAARLGADGAARARPSDFAQALFDLGATICTPAAPACAVCPWMTGCAGRRHGIAAGLPRKSPRTRPEVAARNQLLADRWAPCAAASPPAARPAGRHDRTARHALAGRALEPRRRAGACSDAGDLDPGRRGAAWVYPFRTAYRPVRSTGGAHRGRGIPASGGGAGGGGAAVGDAQMRRRGRAGWWYRLNGFAAFRDQSDPVGARHRPGAGRSHWRLRVLPRPHVKCRASLGSRRWPLSISLNHFQIPRQHRP